MNRIMSSGVPIHLWLDSLEPSALEQVKNLSKLPFAEHCIAIMPDCHTGYGMPIGSVLAAKNVVVPNAVGVDIGCGMLFMVTTLKVADCDLKDIMGRTREVIPVGHSWHNESQGDLPNLPCTDVVSKLLVEAERQLGTLGGGNHFIEFQESDGYLCVMIHSGSRNLGKKVADHYNQLAKALNLSYFSKVDPAVDLAFMPVNTQEGHDYITDMNYCIAFAKMNRALMMDRIRTILDINWSNYETEDVCHNYARYENHMGTNVMIHRKGAISAREGEICIIPGSQGSKSYIGTGKGRAESLMSCSHGAGRVMSRTAAKTNLNLAAEIKLLDDMGVIHSIRSQSDLDEAPSAYKDIEDVMRLQSDLVEITTELTPLGVIKG